LSLRAETLEVEIEGRFVEPKPHPLDIGGDLELDRSTSEFQRRDFEWRAGIAFERHDETAVITDELGRKCGPWGAARGVQQKGRGSDPRG
jgi:hypothetical protein